MSDQTSNGDGVRVIFMPSGRRGRVPAGTTLLDAARGVGVEIESICGGRLVCGKCKVKIEEGIFQKHGIVSSAENVSPPSDDERAYLVEHNIEDYRLSCAARALGDLLVTVPEESQARKQIVRKAAGERVIEVDAAVRQVYVEVEPAVIETPRGDWERLQDALAEQWQLGHLSIDYHARRKLQQVLREGGWKATVTIWQEQEVLDVRPGYHEGAYGLAVDIGSTTVAGHLVDLRTGAVVATESMMNPQVTYGEDLMSRISYSTTHETGLSTMHNAIVKALNRLAGLAAAQVGIKISDIYEAVLVGNTVMHHILLNIDPVELGAAPFALNSDGAIDVKARDLGLRLNAGANVHVMPLVAGHVGADNVAVLLAEAPYQQDDMMLVIDIGTNGEILLGNREGVWSASSPTGPAFEGAQIEHGMRAAAGAIERVRVDRETGAPRFKVIGDDRWSDEWPAASADDGQPRELASGICGSGIIEAIAELFLAGILRPDGRFDPDVENAYIDRSGRSVAYVLATADQTSTGRPIVVTQNDVRAIQLGKAALFAGTKLLMNRAGVERVERVILAGAFGSYISPLHAMVLGLIPDCDLEKVAAVGNAAGDGARIALLNRGRRLEAAERAREVHYVETAIQPEFQQEFVAAMHLPHASEPYPHLADVLPEPPEEAPLEERRAARRAHRRRRRQP